LQDHNYGKLKLLLRRRVLKTVSSTSDDSDFLVTSIFFPGKSIRLVSGGGDAVFVSSGTELGVIVF